MTRYTVSRSGTINAPPARVYAVIADYRTHHPRIVPPEYFKNLEVKQGGVGAGTRTRVVMKVLGATRELEHLISEPEPGRVLVEADVDGSSQTTFVVDGRDGGTTTQLTISTEMAARPGLAGAVERWVTSRMLPKIYEKELARIAEYMAQGPPG